MASNSILNLMGEGDPRRGARRRRVMLSAKLSTSSGEFDVRIRDVSATGARIEGVELPAADTIVVLKRGSFCMFGQLVWVNGERGGIAFDEPLDDAELMETIKGMPAAPAPAPTPYRRPGFTRQSHAPLSDGRGWVDSLPRR